MSRLRLRCVGFAFGGQRPLFTGLELDLGPGVHALTGPNGSGKSTLLRLLAGRLEPSEGSIERPAAVASVAQALDIPSPSVERFADRWDGDACRLRSRLSIDEEGFYRWPTLSPGERQRWQLAAAIHRRADLILLDEPTNHLDEPSRERVEALLRETSAIVVLVSHDRALMDAVATNTLWLEKGALRHVEGGYTETARQRSKDDESRRRLRAKRRDALQALQREHAVRKRSAATAARSVSARSRMKSSKDSDARSAVAKGRAAHAAGSLARASGALAARVERATAALEGTEVREPVGGAIHLGAIRGGSPFLFRGTVGPITRGERRVLERCPVVLRRGARVRVAGPNGAGKTTFVRALLDAVRLDPAEVLELPQDLDVDAREASIARVRAQPPEDRGETLANLAALGVEPEQVLRTALPSPGEARKLLLADALRRGARLLVLDEPENHLDAPSRDRLEAALRRYAGALLLVTHDPRLAERLTDERWTLEAGRLRR